MTEARDDAPRALRPAAPRVTVLLPTFRGAAHIGRCLASLAAQTMDFDDFEVLVVVNGPACDTPELVRSFAETNPRLQLRLIVLAKAGASHARNVGLQAVRGTYVTFVDDDDWITPGYLAAMLEVAERGLVPVAMVGTQVAGTAPGAEPDLDNYVSRSLAPMIGSRVRGDLAPSALSYNAGKLVRTDLAQRVRYDESLRSGEDVVYWLTLLNLAPFEIAVLSPDEALYCREISPGRVGRQDEGYDFMVGQRLECLAAVEGIPLRGPRVQRVATRMRRGQARWINTYLRRHPEEHDRVVAHVHRLGIQEMPWAAVNRGLGRDLAMLYCFPPYLDTSGLVAARRLRERGAVTDVISNDISRFRTLDPGSLRVAAEVVDHHAVLKAPPSFGHWDSVSEFTRLAIEKAGAWQAEKGPYERVYSRSMAVASHFAAALIKLEQPDIEWVAEFSDPLKVHPDASERSSPITDNWLLQRLQAALVERGYDVPESGLFEFAEMLVYALADRLIFTNANQRDLMLGYCRVPELTERASRLGEVSPHPTLPREYYALRPVQYELDPAVVNIAYFGVFYVTRGLEEVLAALDTLAYSERRRLRLHVFTSRPGPLRVDVTLAGLSDVIVVRPFLPFLEFLAATTVFDALLVKDARATEHFGLNPYLPSKISDYRGSATPVWSIVEPGSPLDQVPTAHSSVLCDVADARRVLRALLETDDTSLRAAEALLASRPRR